MLEAHNTMLVDARNSIRSALWDLLLRFIDNKCMICIIFIKCKVLFALDHLAYF